MLQANAPSNPAAVAVPTTPVSGRYALEAVLGVGGYGVVYRGRDLETGRDVAVKLLHPRLVTDGDARVARRFEREARGVGALQHPNTVRVFDYGRADDGGFFLVMELLHGRTLGQALAADGALAPARVVSIVSGVLRALAEAHDAGLVHRDIKPDNVFLARIGAEDDIVKLLDFGLARVTKGDLSALTQTGVIIGTPAYLSPEQCYGQPATAASDLYALGCATYHMLAGRPPFSADDTIGFLLQHSQILPEDVRVAAGPEAGIGPALARWVHRLLKKDPAARFASAADALAALRDATSALADRGAASWTGPTPQGDVYRPPNGVLVGGARAEPPARARGLWAMLALLLVAVALGVWGWTRAQQPASPAEPPTVAAVAPAAVEAPAAEAPAPPPAESSGLTSASAEPASPVASPDEAAPAPPVAAAPAATVARTLTLTSSPPGARVRQGDVAIGDTPLLVHWREGDPLPELTVTLAGRRARDVALTEEDFARGARQVSLERLARRAPRPAEPAPAKDPSPPVALFPAAP